MIKNKKLLITVAAIALAVSVVSVMMYQYYPVFAAPTLDKSWTTVYYTGSEDEMVATFLAGSYGTASLEYNPNNAPDLNKPNQNLIWVGGYAGKTGDNPFPWLQQLSVLQTPDSKPNVEWSKVYNTWVIKVGDTIYDTRDANYGTITVNYDSALRRYVIIIIGVDYWTTTTGGVMLTQLETLPKAGGYIVYTYTGTETGQLSSNIEDYTYSIVKQG